MNRNTQIENILSSFGIFHVFKDAMWRDRVEELAQIQLILPHRNSLNEITKLEAKKRIQQFLGNDLCYGSRRDRIPNEIKEFSDYFISIGEVNTRYYTNSNEGFGTSDGCWSSNPLIRESTMDTGIITKTGKELATVIWVSSID